MLTFAFGSALTGLAGAVLAPIVGAYPTLGIVYVAKPSSRSSPAAICR